MHKRIASAAAWMAVGVLAASAQIEVVKRGAEKTALSLDGMRAGAGEAAATFRRTLESDLVRSGWFTIASGGTSIAVSGSAEQSGGSIRVNCRLTDSVNPRHSFHRSYSEASADARRLAHKVADEIVFALRGVPGIASTRIAIIGSVQGKKDLFLCDADGGRMVQVTREGAVCLAPAWFPDGRSLVYTSFHGGFPDVYRIDLDGGRRTRMAGFPGLNSGAQVSPDGRSMVLTLSKDGNPELYIMDLGSRRLSRLTHTKRAAEASPSWSPDGGSIVYVSDSSGSPQLYIISRSGGQARRLTFRGNENVAPDWGPDGRIAHSSRREGRYHICVVDPRNGSTLQLTSSPADHEDPSWAPDGRHLVYARTMRYQSSLYVLDTQVPPDPEIRLTALTGDWYSPAWSPK